MDEIELTILMPCLNEQQTVAQCVLPAISAVELGALASSIPAVFAGLWYSLEFRPKKKKSSAKGGKKRGRN
ncbi:MAG: hypothetical protein ACI4JT_04850 [Oscillospiraceae bacterium]